MATVQELEADIAKIQSDYKETMKIKRAEIHKAKLRERENIIRELGKLFYADYQKSGCESTKIFHDDCIYAVDVYQKNWEDNEATQVTPVASSSSNFENQKATFGLPEANIF